METLSETISTIVGEELSNLFEEIGCADGCIHQETKALNTIGEITDKVIVAVKERIEKVANLDYCMDCKVKDEDSYGLICAWGCDKWVAYQLRQHMKESILKSLGCTT